MRQLDRAVPELDAEMSIFAFFLDVWKALHDGYPFVNDQPQTRDTPFGDLDSTFIVANASGIYKISHDMDVCRFRQYFAIGSGAEYALGALHVLYETHDDAAEIARTAVHTTCQFDVHCGGEIDVLEVQ